MCSATHAFEIGIFDGCDGEKIWKFTSFDVVSVDEWTAFEKVNVCHYIQVSIFQQSVLVTKVQSHPLSRSVSTSTETSPFDR